MRRALKALVRGICLVVMFPAALTCGFGRNERAFSLLAQTCALVPDLPGCYLRVAFYRMTLRSCSRDFQIGIGAYFAHPQATVGCRVGVGPYSIVGYATIGDGTMLGAHVQILSGGQQHKRNSEGRITDEGRKFVEILIGEHCFIGASAVILANVGPKSTVAAGSVVFTPVPPGIVVGGNPAERWWPPRSVTKAKANAQSAGTTAE